ncbi:preprotein translocase subunit YajC [Canibacter oris]|uniref:Preprotein translocase YajC subunit n=1 Tax=Canibacter oris TaxID=1365628 RepID=A0A840DIW4_9MICO|nr:preprotein translocase YajC subunit [Canibacter oris]
MIDPMSLVMFGLLAVLIFFMFRNNKKRKEMQEQLQNSLRPGVEVMLTSGIFGRIISIDNEANRAVIASGDAAIEVHTQAIAQTVKQEETAEQAAPLDEN